MDNKTKERIAKILPRLATPSEIASSVEGIQKILKAGGYDWHDLTADLFTPSDKVFTEADALEIYRRGQIDGREQARREKPQTETFVNVDTSPPWHEIATECLTRPHYSLREKEFVEDMIKATVNGGEPTEKQQSWLRKIYRRRA
jgi:hypothetical protein